MALALHLRRALAAASTAAPLLRSSASLTCSLLLASPSSPAAPLPLLRGGDGALAAPLRARHLLLLPHTGRLRPAPPRRPASREGTSDLGAAARPRPRPRASPPAPLPLPAHARALGSRTEAVTPVARRVSLRGGFPVCCSLICFCSLSIWRRAAAWFLLQAFAFRFQCIISWCAWLVCCVLQVLSV
ncbi:hypothetical protein PVAP13_8KG143400 [Panicum virgatum]|uniref:Uncharacterized protein n=1 Tax=Panicum virgatum TaxID=38727 RepID=A0A8T0PUP6_PANVG|nr:hypothetical protein PVAP13_8KG143400 [Panicum virgatum]